MEIFVRFLFGLKILNKFFYFLLLIFLCFQTSIAQANEGNKKIESFSKSKNFLKNVHQENPVTFYCQCTYNYNKPNLESCGFRPRKNKKKATRIEWEHILPASHFGIKFDTWRNGHPDCINTKGKKFKGRKCTEKVHKLYRFMQADLYNLQPAIGEVNGLRSNYQIGEIDGEVREFGKCDVEIKNKKVEPAPKIRGDIARTYLYMEYAYPKYVIFNQNLKILIKKWDETDPVDEWECLRAEKIKKIQGNVNQILNKRCQNQDKLNVSNSNPREIQNTTIIYKNNIKSDDLINQNNVIRQNSYTSNKGSFKGKGSNDALK